MYKVCGIGITIAIAWSAPHAQINPDTYDSWLLSNTYMHRYIRLPSSEAQRVGPEI